MKISNKLLLEPKGQPVSAENFRLAQMEMSEMVVMMAIEYVQTRQGAERIYYAEVNGLKRPNVVARATRRMDDFTRPRVPHAEENII